MLIPPPAIYLGCVALALWLAPAASWTFSPLVPELPRRALGGLLLAVGLLFDLWSLALFFRARTSALPFRPASAVVAAGPYRVTRNPMYLGMTLSVLGIGLLVDLAAVAAAGVIAAAIVDFWVIPREERHLEARFGESYLAFKRRVRRWL